MIKAGSYLGGLVGYAYDNSSFYNNTAFGVNITGYFVEIESKCYEVLAPSFCNVPH